MLVEKCRKRRKYKLIHLKKKEFRSIGKINKNSINYDKAVQLRLCPNPYLRLTASDGTAPAPPVPCLSYPVPLLHSSSIVLMYMKKLKDDALNGCYCSSKLEKERGFAFEEYKPLMISNLIGHQIHHPLCFRALLS